MREADMDTEIEQSTQLPILGVQTDPQLARAVANVVCAKRALDGDGWHAVSGMLAGALPGHLGTEPAWPSSVMRVVLPFLELDHIPGSTVSALIPVAQTIGMNCKWSPRNVAAHDRERLVQRLTDPMRASPQDFERSETTWIRQFGIFMAHEGKNRVAFLAAAGVEFMPSLVTAVDYPSAERLKLFEVTDGCERRLVCVLDDEHLVPVQSPSWSLPLLKAYGVKIDAWPDEYPSVEAVCDQLRARTPDHVGRLRPIALSVLKEHLAREASEPRPDALIGHDHIRFYPRPLRLPLSAVVVLLATARAWPEAWHVEGIIVAFCFGAIASAAMCMTAPIAAVRDEFYRALLRSRRPRPRHK
jgi:hypothetical protein